MANWQKRLWQSWRGDVRVGLAPLRSEDDEHKLSFRSSRSSKHKERIGLGAMVPTLHGGLRAGVFAAQFWLEKLVLVIDFLQVVGLLWTTAQPWPWPPFPLVLWSQWTVYFNLDIFSGMTTGALLGATGNISIPKWGMLRGGYVAYSLSFLFVQAALVLLYLGLDRFIFPTWAKRWDQKYRAPCQAVLLFVLYIAYLPVGLAVFRLYFCEISTGPLTSLSGLPAGTQFLSADPSLQCWQGTHLACVVLAILFHGPVFVGLPYVVRAYTREAVVFDAKEDHEKRLQAWEVAFMLRLDPHWLEAQVWLCSSFSLSGAFTLLHTLLLKALLLLLAIFLRNSPFSQAAAMWWSILAYVLLYGVLRPGCFREPGSNAMHKVVLVLLLANASFAAVSASGLRSAVTAASTQSLFLTAINLAGFALFAVICFGGALFSSASVSDAGTGTGTGAGAGASAGAIDSNWSMSLALTVDWPSLRTLRRVARNPLLQPLAGRWVHDLRSALELRERVAGEPPETTDPKPLQQAAARLRKDWLSARSFGSLFQILLQDAIEDSLIGYSMRAPRMHRLHAPWDAAYVEACSRGDFSRRRQQLALMPARKRRILHKLLALRLFTDYAESLPDVNDPSMPLSDGQEAIHGDELRAWHDSVMRLTRRSEFALRREEPARRELEALMYEWATLLELLDAEPRLAEQLARAHHANSHGKAWSKEMDRWAALEDAVRRKLEQFALADQRRQLEELGEGGEEEEEEEEEEDEGQSDSKDSESEGD